MREFSSPVYGLRGQNREDLALEATGDRFSLLITQRGIGNNFNPFGGEPREYVVSDYRRVAIDRRLRLGTDHRHLLSRSPPVRTEGADTGIELALDTSNSDHEELIEICGEDCRELDSLQERVRALFGFEENAVVKIEPAQLAVDEHFGLERRQIGKTVLGGLIAVFGPKSFPVSVPGYNAAPTSPFYLRLCHLDASIHHASWERDWSTGLPALTTPAPRNRPPHSATVNCNEANLAQLSFTAQCTRW